MKKYKQQLTRMDKKSLKQCLQKFPSNEPLYLVFQLSNQLPEIEEIFQSTDLHSNSLFTLYTLNQSHFLCVHDHAESFDNLNPASFQQLTRVIKKSHKNNAQALGIFLDARYLRIAEDHELFTLGQNVRSRVDAIRNDTAQNIPILLAIRNMEDMDGFESWTQSLPESKLDEAFGFAIPDEEIEAQSFVSAAFRSFNDQLIPSEISSDHPSQQLLQSLNTLKKNLVALTNGLIQTQPDLVPPKLIGLYFMGMVNHPVYQSDETDDDPVLIRKPAFVTDVCHRIFSQAASYGSYFHPAKRHGFVYKAMTLSIVVCMLMAIGVLCVMYQSHKNTLQNTYSSITMLQKNITTPHEAIEYFYSLNHHIVSLDQTVSKWWLPWFGFSSNKNPLISLKKNYVETFRKFLLKPLIDQFMAQLRKHISKRSAVKITDQKFHQISGQLMGTLVYYVDFINQFMGTHQKESFAFKPNAYHDGKKIFVHPISMDRFKLFMDCYVNAMIWADDRRPFRKDLHLFKTSVEEMVALLPNLMEWTFPVVIAQKKDIDFSSLWLKNMQTNDPGTKISAAYTREGYTYIQGLFHIIRKTHAMPSSFDSRSKTFYKTYETKYLQEWEQAAKKFESIEKYLQTRESWADILLTLHDIDKNPYFQMINLIVDQTQPFLEHQRTWPQWLQYCHQLHDRTILANTNNPLTKTSTTIKMSETANVFNGYLRALKKIAPLPNTPETSYKLIKTLYVNPGTFCPGDGPETIACLSVFQLQSMWNKKDQNNAAFWDLYEGPINFIRKFSLRETACQLQHHWDDMVLSVDSQAGKGSLVNKQKAGSQKFIQTVASPFLEKITQTRYEPKRLAGLVVPFRDSFFKYIAYRPRPQVKFQDRYPVIIKATPSRTNAQSASQPQLTLIKMKCNQNQQIMVIGHQPTQETFYWSESCGPVHVTFHLKDMKLTRSYPNPMAFPKFIRDVQYGSKRFHRSEFVLDRAKLKAMHTDYVELRLQLFGHEPIAKAQSRGFMTAPEKITYCWEKLSQQIDSNISEASQQAVDKSKTGQTIQKAQTDISVKTEPNDTLNKKLKKKESQENTIEKPDVRADANIYIVIVASFRNDTNAVNKAKRLTKDGLKTAVYWLKDKDENPWYIVVSGMYASYSEAMKSVDQIKTMYNMLPFIKKMEKKTIAERKVNF
jgi:type VI secretion system protein ImpL